MRVRGPGGPFDDPKLLWSLEGGMWPLEVDKDIYLNKKKQEKSMEINENQLKSMQLDPIGKGKLNISNFCPFQRSCGNCSGGVISHPSKWL